MEELYRIIEEKIRQAGYPGAIDGREFYEEVSDEADEKEPGDYMFLIKETEEIIYKGSMTILEDQFDLHYVDIMAGDKTWHVDFDN